MDEKAAEVWRGPWPLRPEGQPRTYMADRWLPPRFLAVYAGAAAGILGLHRVFPALPGVVIFA